MKNRLHPDLAASDYELETDRLIKLSAVKLNEFEQGAAGGQLSLTPKATSSMSSPPPGYPIPGAEMGAANIGQARPGTVCRTDRRLLTCANVREEPLRSPAYLADKDTCGQLHGRGDVRHR